MKKLKQVSLLLASFALLVFSICFSRPANPSDYLQHQTSIDQLASLAEDDIDELICGDQFIAGNYLPVCVWIINSDHPHKPLDKAFSTTRVSPLPFYLQVNTLRI